ncbi:MAG: ABC transporter permease [Akkermansia sp.]
MKFFPLLKTCLRALVRNPMRAALTILGIIIGIAAVIAMMEIGRGSTDQIRSTIASMGANTLNVSPGSITKSGVKSGAGGRASLTPSDCEAIARECVTVVRATPVMRTGGQVIYGNKNWNVGSIEGGSVDYLKARDWYEMMEGNPFTENDVAGARRVCLLGQTIVNELFQGESPVGKDIRIKNVSFKVIGVLKKKGANMMGRDQDDIVVMPWTSVRARLQGLGGSSTTATSSTTTSSSRPRADIFASSSVNYYATSDKEPYKNVPHPRRFKTVENIMVEIANPDRSAESVAEITALLRARHRLQEDEEDDFRIWDMAEISRVMSSTTQVMTNLLLVVAMISLVVGGVGIMNIMLVSVTERTREIGLRMAVGARPNDIMSQFLLEAIILCLAGGAIGIVAGRGVSMIVGHFLKWPVATAPEAMLLAVGVSAFIGCVFGWYPAWKASQMDPIDALRHE